ncbi:hypothetical protein ACFWVB_20050 [Streptomyces microflavus]|uniref:hypothetical protein n=1 Tax=Streptomyces microflavus TaxID=1919 RepID=UPI00364602B6
MDVTGVAAVLDRPMRGRPVIFTDPSPLLTTAGACILRDEERIGTVTRMWVDGDLVRWEGHIPPVMTWPVTPDDDEGLVPLVDPPVGGLIAKGELVGITDLVQGRMETRDGVTVLSQWSVGSISLIRPLASPWDDLCLGIRDTGTAGSATLST